MTYILTALDAEARPLIEHYRLKRFAAFPYPLYTGEGMYLIISGMGRENAMMAASALCGYRQPSANDILINIGICGAPERYSIGEWLIIHQIRHFDRTFYPDILYSHPFKETSLSCVDRPADASHDIPVDMESAGVFAAASRFFKLHQLAFAKIVSDHFDPASVTKEGVGSLVRQNLPRFEALMKALLGVSHSDDLLTQEEKERLETLKSYVTASQARALEEAFCYFKLKNPDRAIPVPEGDIPNSKRERSRWYEHLIALLTH